MLDDTIYSFMFTPILEQYYSEDSNWGVYKILTDKKLPYLKPYEFMDNKFYGQVVGNMQKLSMNCKYSFEGTIIYNKKYKSYQYKPNNIKALKPTTIEDQENFLKAILTDRQTKILLKSYPNIVDDILKNKPIDLKKTKGIKEATFNKIKEKIIDNFAMSDLLVLLSPLGIKLNIIKKLFNENQNIDLIKQQIIENPYIFTKIKGLGFKKIDDFALKVNPDLKISKFRIRAYVLYKLKEIASKQGHTLIKRIELLNFALKDVPECKDVYREYIKEEEENSIYLYLTKQYVGLKKYYKVEKGILDHICFLNKEKIDIKDKQMSDGILNAEKQQKFKYSEEQIKAIKSIKDNNVIIITANAGSGKTSILKAFLEIYNKEDIVMCALAAKAARRMKEVTNFDNCITIHKLLGIDPESGGFLHNKQYPLPYKVIIVDECSMINSELFYSLIQAIPSGSKLILSFDDAQLPPIGGGNPAKDLLKSNVKINRLTKVYRQAEESGILSDANKIRKSINPLDKPSAFITHGILKDMHYRFRDNMQSLNDLAIEGFMQSLNKCSLDDIVIIVPRKKDCINSIREINKIIENKLIDSNIQSIKRNDGTEFRIGAKIIQKVNDKENNIINGEIGYIIDVFKEQKKNCFTVDFGENKIVKLKQKALNDMELAYAQTCHSCQGSQYKKVLGILDMSHYMLLNNEMIYTLMTRAEENCWLLMQPQAFVKCLRTHANRRNTFMSKMLTKQI